MKKIFIIFLPLIMLFSYFLINVTFKDKTIKNMAKKKIVIILLGPPGAGKGTHAEKLSQSLGLPHISTGDLFRENLKNHTPLGEKAKGYIEKGNLVPDDIVLDMLYSRIKKEDCKKGYILDGFPRTLSQAKALDKKLENTHYIALNLNVEDEKILERITNRLTCKTCKTLYHKIFLPPKKTGICDKCGGDLYQRSDDSEDIVKNRLKVYHEQTEPLIEFYKNKDNVFTNIDGGGTKETVFHNLMHTIEEKNIL